VQRITPILARRTEKYLAQAAVKRVERWRRIAHEASQQSRRTSVPEVADPIALKAALAAEQAPVRILLSETEQSLSLTDALAQRPAEAGSCALAIGPEGGWTPDEMALFTAHQWTPVTLGPRILRAETAAIAAIAIAGSLLG
jgi:16S rRNA (uracil1498-N3)-methyltransferase